MGMVVAIPSLACHTVVIGGTELPQHSQMTELFAQTVIQAYYANDPQGLIYNLKLTQNAGETLQDLAQEILDKVKLDEE